MKFYKTPSPQGLIAFVIIWMIMAGISAEYVVNRPNPSWMFYSALFAMVILTSVLISVVYRYLKGFFELNHEDFHLNEKEEDQGSQESQKSN